MKIADKSTLDRVYELSTRKGTYEGTSYLIQSPDGSTYESDTYFLLIGNRILCDTSLVYVSQESRVRTREADGYTITATGYVQIYSARRADLNYIII